MNLKKNIFSSIGTDCSIKCSEGKEKKEIKKKIRKSNPGSTYTYCFMKNGTSEGHWVIPEV